MNGTVGDLTFEKVGLDKTEIGISAKYDHVVFPLPKIFAEFGIEVILRRTAVRMRTHFEEIYKKRGMGP